MQVYKLAVDELLPSGRRGGQSTLVSSVDPSGWYLHLDQDQLTTSPFSNSQGPSLR